MKARHELPPRYVCGVTLTAAPQKLVNDKSRDVHEYASDNNESHVSIGLHKKNGAHAFNRERWQPAAYPYYRHDTHHSEFTPRYDSITKARSRSLRVVPASQSRRRFTAAANPLRLSRPHSTCNDVVDNGGTPKLPKKVPLWLEAERRHCSTGVTGAVANVWEASIAGQ